jgi:predicted Zn-dependent protease
MHAAICLKPVLVVSLSVAHHFLLLSNRICARAIAREKKMTYPLSKLLFLTLGTMLLNVKRYGAQTTLGLYKKHYKNTKDFPNVWKLYAGVEI